MNENTEIDILEYYQTPLSSLSLQDNYAKLVKRIMKLNGSNNSLGEIFIVESVGDIVALEPYQFSQCKGVGNNYIEMLIEFKKELPYFLSKLKKEPDFVFQDDIFTSIDNGYDFETPIYQLALSPKYEKLIKRISAVMNNVETVQDIIDIDIYTFSKLPAVGKLYVESLIALQNVLSPEKLNQFSRLVAPE